MRESNYVLHYQTGTGSVINKNLSAWLHPGVGTGLRVFVTVLLSAGVAINAFLYGSPSGYSAMSLVFYFLFAIFLQFTDKKMLEEASLVDSKLKIDGKPKIGEVLKVLRVAGLSEYKVSLCSQVLFLLLTVGLFCKAWLGLVSGASNAATEPVVTLIISLMGVCNIYALVMCRSAIYRLDVGNSDVVKRILRSRPTK